MRKLNSLVKFCKKQGVIITFVDGRRLRDYAGMNPNIAAQMGFTDIKPNEILIDRTLPEETQYHTLVHELIEKKLMDEGNTYWQSHWKALRLESKPIRKKSIFNLKRATK